MQIKIAHIVHLIRRFINNYAAAVFIKAKRFIILI